MRVVEYPKSTTSLNYQVIRGLGIVAGIFSLIVCALMIANNLSLKRADPIHSPALMKLLEDLKGDPRNVAIKEEIRELDYLARKAFFTSQQFNRTAVYLLVGGLSVMVVSFKTMEAYKTAPPFPDSGAPKDDLIGNAAWARKSVTAAGLVMAGFALILALPWKSTLDESSTAPAPTAATPAETATNTEAPPPPPVIASREEMLRNWPHFRGAANAVLTDGELPTDWDGVSGRGITWKTAVPKSGFSSPIIWDNRIFLTGGDKESREVYCYSTAKGELLWKNVAEGIPGTPDKPPPVAGDTGHAASTMATDGARVFAIFANGDLLGLDMDGHRVWARNLGLPENSYGHSSSLVTYQDLLLVQFDHEKDGFLLAVDVATGKDRWKAQRNLHTSWSSPALIETEEGPLVILSAEPAIVAYDPRDGKELWRMPVLEGGEVAPTPVYADGLLYLACDYVKTAAVDIRTRKIVWESTDAISGISTPLVAGDYFVGGTGEGGMVCLNAETGEEIWFEITDNGFYSSPILVKDRVYLADREGTTHIFTLGKEFKSVGRPKLGEPVVATPAVKGNSLFVRGTKHLFRIGS